MFIYIHSFIHVYVNTYTYIHTIIVFKIESYSNFTLHFFPKYVTYMDTYIHDMDHPYEFIVFSIAVYHSIVSMWHEYCIRYLLLDHPDPLSTHLYSALWEADSHGFPCSWLVLMGLTNRKPWEEVKEKGWGQGTYFLAPSMQVCLSLALSLNWRPLLLPRSFPLLYFPSEFGHRFLSLGPGRVTALFLFKLGYWNSSYVFPTYWLYF